MTTTKELREMRKQVREADEIALINKRAYSIFRSMGDKAKELNRSAEIDFTVEDLRARSRELRGSECGWCKRTITAKSFSWDHRIPISRGGTFSMENLRGCCNVCNGQKGNMTPEEFFSLRALISTWEDKGRIDVLRRLGLGARWRS